MLVLTESLKAIFRRVLCLSVLMASCYAPCQITWTGSPQLVDPSLTGEYYEYAPSAMVDPRNSSQTDIWSCHNTAAGVISDHIFYTGVTSSGTSIP